jgi:hypothetical protein
MSWGDAWDRFVNEDMPRRSVDNKTVMLLRNSVRHVMIDWPRIAAQGYHGWIPTDLRSAIRTFYNWKILVSFGAIKIAVFQPFPRLSHWKPLEALNTHLVGDTATIVVIQSTQHR